MAQPLTYLPYFTPIVEDQTKKDPLWSLRVLDGFLSFNNKTAKITTIENGVSYVEFDTKEINWKTTAAKVALFATVFLPCIALFAKIIYRAYHKFEPASHKNTLVQLNTFIDEKEDEIQKLSQENETRINAVEKEKETLLTEREKFKSSNTALNRKILSLEGEIKHLRSELENTNKQLATRDKQVEEEKRKLRILPDKIKELQQEIKDLQEQHEKTLELEKIARRNLCKASNDKIKLDAELRALLPKYQNLKDENQALKTRLDEEVNKNKRLSTSTDLSEPYVS